MADTIIVFTSRSIKQILETGGSQAWRLRPANANAATYLVCTRNRKSDRNEGTEEHGAGFLVARISGIEPAPDDATRYMIAFEEWAQIDVPELWQFGRNPIHYANLGELGIDVAAIEFKPRGIQTSAAQRKCVGVVGKSHSKAVSTLSIAEAKRGLAVTFGVGVDAVEITIRG